MNEERDPDARLWHPWLRINRVLRVMLHTHWSAEAWSQVRVEFRGGGRAAERDPARGVVQLTAPAMGRWTGSPASAAPQSLAVLTKAMHLTSTVEPP
jgi:hypothetical protein